MRRRLGGIAAAGCALLALAGCGGDRGVPTPTAAPAVPEAPFTVGVFAPRTGVQGQDIADGARLAAEDLAGGLAGATQVRLVFCDSGDGEDVARAVACVDRLASQDRVDALVGGASSAEGLGVRDAVVAAKRPFVSVAAPASDLTEDVTSSGPQRFLFRIGPPDTTDLATDLCLTAVARVAPETGFTRFGVLAEDSDLGRPVGDLVSSCLTNPAAATDGRVPISQGVQLVGVQRHASDATDVSAQLDALARAGAQYVVEVSSGPAGRTVVQQWGQRKPPFALGGINAASERADFFDATGGAAAGQLNGPGGLVRSAVTDLSEPFVDSFRARFDRDPTSNAATSYDAVRALSEAVDRVRAAGSDPTKPPDVEAVVTELARTNRLGIQGRETLDTTHDVRYGGSDPETGLVPTYFQWDASGQRVLVYPSTVAGAQPYRLPPWVPRQP